ncbi:MAG: C-GCAxxG-C-C family protein [Chloroflexi bacterium]|nr:C-GCAxxG-C-C family protein [Chloroflexota bacterium]
MPRELSRTVLLDKIEKAAYEYERKFHGCSRCTLLPLQEYLELGDGSALRAAVPLAGGIAMTGDTCGALLGGLLAVGLATADEDMENREAFLDSLVAGFRFYRKFKQDIGHTTCRDIQMEKLGRYYNMADPEEYEEFTKAEGYLECAKVAARASRLAAEFILEQWERGVGKPNH